jgi:hypothetical protein
MQGGAVKVAEDKYVWIKMDPRYWWCSEVIEWRKRHPEFSIERPREMRVSREGYRDKQSNRLAVHNHVS